MSQDDNSRLMILFVGGLFVVAIAMMVVIFVATRRPVVMILPGAGDSASPVTAGTQGTAGAGTVAAAAAPLPLPEVPVMRVNQAPAVDDPLDSAWNQIASVEIPLEMQQSAEPMMTNLTVPNITVQAARDNQRFVWRLSWEQPQPVYQSNVGQFSDGVAMQFPMKDGAPYTMGGPDMPVTMLYWKALWQKDIDEGFQDVTSVYPNSWNDFYWFANTTGPTPVATGFENKASHQYMTGIATGNPMSDVVRAQPLEELTAHGFGSSTHVGNSPSQARGVWQDGSWYVVIDRPASATDPLIARFNENPDQQLIAFAVFDGNAENRGGRKQITNWIPMRIDK